MNLLSLIFTLWVWALRQILTRYILGRMNYETFFYLLILVWGSISALIP